MKQIRQKVRDRIRRPLRWLFRLVFSHSFLTVFLIVVQIVLLIWAFSSLSDYSKIVGYVNTLLSFLLIILIVNSDEENPMFRLAWIVPICIFPVLGVFLYVFGKFNIGGIGVRRRILQREKMLKPYFQMEEDLEKRLEQEDLRFARFAHYMNMIGDAKTYENCQVKYYPLGDDQYNDILQDLRDAKSFIFIEFFIISRGTVWDTILEILKEKVQEGVEVRVLYDGMNSMINLPYNYPKKLQEYGIHAKQFSPIKPILSTHQNNRDHRKIIVVDGKIGYTGGVNLADEYMNLKQRFGHWKDTSVRIQGPAVKSFTAMFLQSWDLDEVSMKECENYLGEYSFDYEQQTGYVLPYADGPHRMENVAETAYLKVIQDALHYVHIMTPYLILDQEMMNTLTYAARKGVDVKIIMPYIPDKKIAFYIANTYYPSLIMQGVKVYEYMPGFVHAKTFSSDDHTSIVGSINLDYRSLYLHYECAALFYKHPVCKDIEEDFQNTLRECRMVTMETYKEIPFYKRALGRVFRLIGPLM